MGCDIHIFIEYRNKGLPWQADDGHQVEVDDACGTCDHCKNNKPEDCEDAYISVSQANGGGRNYSLFAALAGVRGDGPEPKGVPDDVSPMIAKAIEHYGSDGHSHSYYSLDEFKKILKEQKLFHKKHKKDRVFAPWKSFDKPEDWPDYMDIVNHCQKIVDDKAINKILLGDEESDVEVRIVFYFDN